jgi:hypothetical protein
MAVTAEKKLAVEVVYNGVGKSFEVEPEEHVSALLQKAIATFGITQQPHLLSLFRQDGSVVPENESVERAGLRPGEVLLLRPNAVKGGGGLLRLSTSVLDRTFEALRKCGAGKRECVVYWTGPSNQDLVDCVDHPLHKSWPYGYQVSDNWLTSFWFALADSRRSVKAQVHTHPGRAFHSTTDDKFPIVSQAGFMSIVIPNFATGEQSLDSAWIGCLQTDGGWQHLASASEAFIACSVSRN